MNGLTIFLKELNNTKYSKWRQLKMTTPRNKAKEVLGLRKRPGKKTTVTKKIEEYV